MPYWVNEVTEIGLEGQMVPASAWIRVYIVHHVSGLGDAFERISASKGIKAERHDQTHSCCSWVGTVIVPAGKGLHWRLRYGFLPSTLTPS